MKSQKIPIVSITIIIIGVALYYLIFNRATLFNTSENVSNQLEQTTLQVQSVTIGKVIYKITPKSLIPNSKTWDFEVSLDTHAGSLDQDLVSEIRMADDKGNEYKALEWVGDSTGGHHRAGVLKFSPITPRPVFIEFNIETAGSTEKNSLRWNI